MRKTILTVILWNTCGGKQKQQFFLFHLKQFSFLVYLCSLQKIADVSCAKRDIPFPKIFAYRNTSSVQQQQQQQQQTNNNNKYYNYTCWSLQRISSVLRAREDVPVVWKRSAYQSTNFVMGCRTVEEGQKKTPDTAVSLLHGCMLLILF